MENKTIIPVSFELEMRLFVAIAFKDPTYRNGIETTYNITITKSSIIPASSIRIRY